MSISWLWIPGRSVGPFHLGYPVDKFISKYNLVRLEEREYLKEDWETYEIPGYETRIHAENSIITNVLCYDSLLYEGRDIIGLTLDEVRLILGTEDDIERDSGLWDAAYYGRLGLTLWIRDGVVESAACDVVEEH